MCLILKSCPSNGKKATIAKNSIYCYKIVNVTNRDVLKSKLQSFTWTRGKKLFTEKKFQNILFSSSGHFGFHTFKVSPDLKSLSSYEAVLECRIPCNSPYFSGDQNGRLGYLSRDLEVLRVIKVSKEDF